MQVSASHGVGSKIAPRPLTGVREEAVSFGKESLALAALPEQKRLRQDVEALCRWFRNPEHMGQLNQAADYIGDQWRGMGLTVTEQPFEHEGRTFRNVMVSLGPKDGERVVVGAHYDVYRDQPGADDNASGVAGLLELTRKLLPRQAQLKKRLDLVAYTLEEAPYYTLGSRRHVEQLLAEKVRVKAMLSLEMIGYFRNERGTQRYPAAAMKPFYPNRGNFIAAVGFGPAWRLMPQVAWGFWRQSPIPLRMLYWPGNQFGLNRSDHRYFAENGIPALMITDTADYRNGFYHSPRDTIYTLDFARMAQVVQGVYGTVLNLAA